MNREFEWRRDTWGRATGQVRITKALQDDIGATVRELTHAIHGDDMGVSNARQESGFVIEPGTGPLVFETKNFDRDGFAGVLIDGREKMAMGPTA